MPREALLTRTLVELADSLVQDFDVVDLLTLLDDRCVEVVDIAADGLMLDSVDGELRVVASSSEAMPVLELCEGQSEEGPCIGPYRSGQPVVNPKIDEVDSRWSSLRAQGSRGRIPLRARVPMRLRGTASVRSTCFGSTRDRYTTPTWRPLRPRPTRAELHMEQASRRLRRHAGNHNLRPADIAHAVSTKALAVTALDPI